MDFLMKLSEIQRKMKAPKSKYNEFGNFHYRSAEDILEAFKPYEEEYKVSMIIRDDVVAVGDRVYVKATAQLLDCESPQEASAWAYARESDTKKGMDGSQITGTASSYARKYALNGLFLLDDTKDPDTNEYGNQTGRKKKEETPGSALQAAEPPLSNDGDKPADEAKLKTIESICKKHGFTPEAMCKSNGLTWPNITNERAACMLKTLKEKYKDE